MKSISYFKNLLIDRLCHLCGDNLLAKTNIYKK